MSEQPKVNASAVGYAKEMGYQLAKIESCLWGIYGNGSHQSFSASQLVRECRKLVREAEMLRHVIDSS